MDVVSTALVALGFVAYALVSGRLHGSMFTAPMLFIAFGLSIGAGGIGVIDIGHDHRLLHTIAEVTLILVLFADAARIDFAKLRRDFVLPGRLLLIGLPLTILLGTLVGHWLLPQFMWAEAALLAAIHAPTDAALGQAVVANRDVPVRIRQALNVESGLNDGIALPAVLMLAALSSMMGEEAGAGQWLRFAALQVTLGPLVGGITGYAGARAIDAFVKQGWISTGGRGIAILALAMLTFAGAELVGGNGFIAAFVGGLVFGNSVRHPCDFLFEFMESEGELLMLATFLLFGAVLLPLALGSVSVAVVLYAALSLTVVRMVPAAIALLGTGVRWRTVAFLGWFGPRGLASILFALLVLDEHAVMASDLVLTITVVTVTLSALLHGASAAPLARAYARVTEHDGTDPERQDAAEIPLRDGPMRAAR